MNKIEFSKLEKKEDMIMEFNQLKDDYSLLFSDNQDLKKQVEELEFIVGLRQKRTLIRRFEKEYDEEDKKKNPNRDYAGIIPDAEEVYKRYYAMKKQQKEFIEWLEEKIPRSSCIGEDGFGRIQYESKDIYYEINKILLKYKEIIGGKHE